MSIQTAVRQEFKKQLKILLFVVFVVFITVTASACDEVFIISGEQTKVMIRVEAASGEKYEAVGDPDTIFWSKGDEASLTVEGKEYHEYVLVRLVRAFSDRRPDELILTVDGKNYTMKMVVSASGAKYEALDDPETTLWSKGASVTLTVAGVVYPDYDIWQPLGRIWLNP